MQQYNVPSLKTNSQWLLASRNLLRALLNFSVCWHLQIFRSFFIFWNSLTISYRATKINYYDSDSFCNVSLPIKCKCPNHPCLAFFFPPVCVYMYIEMYNVLGLYKWTCLYIKQLLWIFSSKSTDVDTGGCRDTRRCGTAHIREFWWYVLLAMAVRVTVTP